MKPEKDQEVDHDFDKKDLDANLPPMWHSDWKARTGRCLAVSALRMALTNKINSGGQLQVTTRVVATAERVRAPVRWVHPLVSSEVPSGPDHKT